MGRKGFLTIVLVVAGLAGMDAQTTAYTWQDFVEEMADDAYAEEQGWTEQMEELALLAARPMDINTATREDLRRLPFLSDEQIEEIHEYVFLHQGMRSTSELMAIPSVDYRTRRFLSLFLYADQAVFARRDTLTLKGLLHNARHEAAVRMDIPLYYRDGYNYPPPTRRLQWQYPVQQRTLSDEEPATLGPRSIG